MDLTVERPALLGFRRLGPARLLDDEVVLDVRHTGNGGGVLPAADF